jgi:hypothetical protein
MTAAAYANAATLFSVQELRAIQKALLNETSRVINDEGPSSPKLEAIREARGKVAVTLKSLEHMMQLADVAA